MSTSPVWDSKPMKMAFVSNDDDESDEDESEGEIDVDVDVDEWELIDRKRLASLKSKDEEDMLQTIDELEKLAIHATTPAQLIQIILSILDCLFSLVTAPLGVNHALEGHLSVEAWNSIIPVISLLLNLLELYPNIILNTNQLYNGHETKKPASYYGNIYIHSDLAIYIQKLERHLSMRFQCINFFTPSQFLEIFRYESILFVVAENFFRYFDMHKDYARASIASLIMVKIVHCKNNFLYSLLSKSLPTGFLEQQTTITQSFVVPSPLQSTTLSSQNSSSLLDDLASYIFNHGDHWTKVHSTLYHLYHCAITDNYSKGVEIGRRRGLQNLRNMSVSTQLLFNRAIAHLGLCAFRAGFPLEAHHLLSVFDSCGVAEDLLAQGGLETNFSCNTVEQQFHERRRSVPYHMRINLEHLRSVQVMCSHCMENPTEMKSKLVRMKYTGIPKLVHDHMLFIRNNQFRISSIDSVEFWKLKKEKN